MKVAIVHYWFVNWRGGEKVVDALLELYPNADVYAHVYDPSVVSEAIKDRYAGSTFINKLPRSRKWYQHYLPFMPLALEQLDLTDYDLVISSESGPAKGVVTRPDALHVCYCHSPMRYVWDMYHLYLRNMKPVFRPIFRILVHYLKQWDQSSSNRVDHYVANSSYVSKRIEKCYRRDSEVIAPPVDIEEFSAVESKKDFYLLIGQLTPYKRADLAVSAFLNSKRKLVVVGTGEQLKELDALCANQDNISIMGWQDWETCKKYLAEARAIIFPGVEDFGMVPVEAMASGTPVIALAKGGVLDSVEDGKTGVLYCENSVSGLAGALDRFETIESSFEVSMLRDSAESFSKQNFANSFSRFVLQAFNDRKC